jgi:hypothetical protein
MSLPSAVGKRNYDELELYHLDGPEIQKKKLQ